MSDEIKNTEKNTTPCGACKGCKLKAALGKINTPLEKGLIIATGFAAGLAVGLLLSPITGGISIGSNNGCNNRAVKH